MHGKSDGGVIKLITSAIPITFFSTSHFVQCFFSLIILPMGCLRMVCYAFFLVDNFFFPIHGGDACLLHRVFFSFSLYMGIAGSIYLCVT